jgi:hypothetical protein
LLRARFAPASRTEGEDTSLASVTRQQ